MDVFKLCARLLVDKKTWAISTDRCAHRECFSHPALQNWSAETLTFLMLPQWQIGCWSPCTSWFCFCQKSVRRHPVSWELTADLAVWFFLLDNGVCCFSMAWMTIILQYSFNHFLLFLSSFHQVSLNGSLLLNPLSRCNCSCWGMVNCCCLCSTFTMTFFFWVSGIKQLFSFICCLALNCLKAEIQCWNKNLTACLNWYSLF